MNATATRTPTRTVTDLLTERLAVLRTERDETSAETRGEATGDAVDRATNVEASIRLSMLEERIAALELEIAESRHHQHTDGVVSLGDTVVLDLGDGPETFVVGSVETSGAGVQTVTPSSPLGRAIVDARVGATVSYEPLPGRVLEAKVVTA